MELRVPLGLGVELRVTRVGGGWGPRGDEDRSQSSSESAAAEKSKQRGKNQKNLFRLSGARPRRDLTCLVVVFRPRAHVRRARLKLRCSTSRRRHRRTVGVVGVGGEERNHEAFVLFPHVEGTFVACRDQENGRGVNQKPEETEGESGKEGDEPLNDSSVKQSLQQPTKRESCMT